jgi:hypothetical protein
VPVSAAVMKGPVSESYEGDARVHLGI